MTTLQTKIDSQAVSFTAIVTSPVKMSLGDFETKMEAERALASIAISLGNVQGDIFPRI